LPVATEILYYAQSDFYEQARCLFHKQITSCGTGILPVATEILYDAQLAFYEQARCLFHPKNHLLWNGHLAR
jgi:hypothetical protein